MKSVYNIQAIYQIQKLEKCFLVYMFQQELAAEAGARITIT